MTDANKERTLQEVGEDAVMATSSSSSAECRTNALAEDAIYKQKDVSMAEVTACEGPSPRCLGLRFRQLLQANEHVVLCEANASLGIEWLSPNALLALGGNQQRGSVLSLVAPESRGFVSRAIFRAARENTTRVCVRANDGRDADLVVVADNEYLRLQRAKDSAHASTRTNYDDPRLSRASGSSYAIGLFIFDSRRPPGSRLPAFQTPAGNETWTKASGEEAAKVGAQISIHGDCLCLFDVDDDGLVVDAMGACDELTLSARELVGTSPLEVVLADDRARVSTAFAQARNAGASSACQIHRCASNYSATTLAISTCAFLPDSSNTGSDARSMSCRPEAAGCVVLVYVACHRQSTTSRLSESSSSLASIARELSLKETESLAAGSKKRKRTLSTSVLIAPTCDGGSKRPSGLSASGECLSDQFESCGGSTSLKELEGQRIFEEERASANEPCAQNDTVAACASSRRLFEEERASANEPSAQNDTGAACASARRLFEEGRASAEEPRVKDNSRVALASSKTCDSVPQLLRAERRRRANCAPSDDDESDWGHFVFPDGEPDFNLPPISPTVITQRSHRAAAYRAAIERERSFMSTEGAKESDLSYEAQPKEGQRNGHMRSIARLPDSTRVVIDLDSVLPRQQSIDNYQRAVAAMAPAPAVRYSSLALDNLISNVLPRPESIADFRASMRELGRRRPSGPAHKSVMSIDFSDDDKYIDDDDMWDGDDDDVDVDSLVDENDDVIVDLVNSTTFSSKYAQRRSVAACPDISPSFSRLCFPLDSAQNSFSIDSSPPPLSNNTPMDTSALCERPSLTDASDKAGRTELVKPRQRQVHIVG